MTLTEQKTDELSRWRAAHAEALDLAQAFRKAAPVFRRYAGELKYHPQTGLRGHIGRDLLDAAALLRNKLNVLNDVAAQWVDEEAWLRSLDANLRLDDVHSGHSAAREAARRTKAALEIFERTALHPEPATLDAPYGHGAPRRVHPGAQCTWVAERAEDLAREVSTVSLRKENLLLR
jgi:hypothetical protein